jgi:hypothetical protein
MSIRRASTAAAILVIGAGTTMAQQAADEPPQPHEAGPVNPPADVARDAMPRSVAARPARGLFMSVQANVDEFGNNILGDAANEPSIAVDPTAPNRMAIGWRQFDTTSSNFRQAGYAYTIDGGRSWTFPGVIEPGVFRSDPVLDVDNNGRFYYNSLTVVGGNTYICDVFTSDDGGATWGNRVDAYGGDKQWMIIDRTGGVGEGNIYAAWSDYFSSCSGSFTRSTNGGASYEPCIDVPRDPFWVTLAVGPDGDLYEAGYDWFAGQIAVSKSTNAKFAGQVPVFGQTRTVNMGGQPISGAGPNPGGLLGQIEVDCDTSGGPHSGNVYIVASVDPPGGDPMNVTFSRSTDGGNTWSSPVRINDVQTGWQWFGTMSVAPNGRIDVIWNDTRNAGGGYDSELYYAFSADGGVTWSANEPLSPPWDPYLGWPNQNKIGDYYHMVSDNVGAHLAWAATFNGEQDVYYLRIGDYDCNGNGIGDADDLASGLAEDCNGNGIPDSCDIASGVSEDLDGDGRPDECGPACEGDLNGDGLRDLADLGILLAAYNVNADGDINGDGVTDLADLGILLANYNVPC